jgi:5,6-dimethylbenzimidazole synthase
MKIATPGHQADHAFSEAARAAVYHAIFSRRDVRGQFLPDPVPDEVLARVLTAAHFAPSVGYMQPWSFVVVRDAAVKDKMHAAFREANAEALDLFEAKQQAIYRELKLEGIREAPINLCITCDRDRAGPVVLGRTHNKAMDIYSTVCAVQNLWLAARAEGLGVGWVSIFDKAALRDTLALPDRIVPIAYLCVGYVSHFYDQPELEAAGWRERLPLDDLLHFDRWGDDGDGAAEALRQQVRQAQAKATRGGTF